MRPSRALAAIVIAAATVPATADGHPAVDAAVPPARSAPATDPGFQWADAGVGAAGAVVLFAAGAGLSVGVRRRRGDATAAG